MSDTGWTDDRFMDAYDAIHGIIATHATAEDKLPEIRALLADIERADGLLAEVLTERAKIGRGSMNAKPAELTRDQWVYKGWQISWDMPPIPSRDFDWCAQSPDFDAEYDDGVLTICGGQQVNAATYEDLLQEIENAIEENAA